MNAEFNEYYKITDLETVKRILAVKTAKYDWMKLWDNEAKSRGFDAASIIRDHSCCGFFQGRLEGFALGFDKIGTVDLGVYKLVHVDKHNKLNIYQVRKGNKKEYAKYKEFADSIGETKNLNKIGEIMFGVKQNQYPVGEINFGVKGHILLRAVWFGRDREGISVSEHMIRIKKSEYLALQGK